MIQFKNQRYKIVQEAKRQWLNISLNVYEIKIQEYQQEYQYQLIELETQLLNSAILNSSLVYNHVDEYLNYQTEKLKRNIYSESVCFLRQINSTSSTFICSKTFNWCLS